MYTYNVDCMHVLTRLHNLQRGKWGLANGFISNLGLTDTAIEANALNLVAGMHGLQLYVCKGLMSKANWFVVTISPFPLGGESRFVNHKVITLFANKL